MLTDVAGQRQSADRLDSTQHWRLTLYSSSTRRYRTTSRTSQVLYLELPARLQASQHSSKKSTRQLKTKECHQSPQVLYRRLPARIRGSDRPSRGEQNKTERKIATRALRFYADGSQHDSEEITDHQESGRPSPKWTTRRLLVSFFFFYFSLFFFFFFPFSSFPLLALFMPRQGYGGRQ